VGRLRKPAELTVDAGVNGNEASTDRQLLLLDAFNAE
jgi:hypothetical protein